MVERNEKDRQVRRYFIECEKQLMQKGRQSEATQASTADRKAQKNQEEKTSRYYVRVIVYDNLFGSCVELHGRADTFQAIASGIATDMGYKPTGLIQKPYAAEKIRKIY